MTTSLPTTRLGWTGMHLTRTGFGAWAIGGGDWAYGGAARTTPRRSRPSGTRSIRDQLDRHRRRLRARTLRRGGGAALAGLPEADRPYVFTKGGLVWDGRPLRGAPPGRRAGQHQDRGRGLAAAAAGRADRPLPDASAGRGRHAARGVLAGLPRPQARGQDPRGRTVQPLHLAARGGRADRRCGRHPAAVQPDPPRRRGDVLLWAREHEAGVIVYSPMARACSPARSRGRAARLGRATGGPAPRVHRACAVGQPCSGRGSAAGRRASRCRARGGSGRLDVGLPRSDRRHRRCPQSSQVDGWLPAATLELKDDDLSDIAAAIQATGAGTGPASPVQ